MRYCITLDSDTRLPRDAARRLIGIIAHPLQPAASSTRALGRVTAGYGILQPRVSVTMASAAGSLFARIYAGHTGVDPYTTAVSDVYQDLFGEGIFTGKGLYDVDAFTAALEGRVPENALLSHDLFEGLYARTALVTDVEVVDDYPSSVLAHARRQHRWVRGDWQILWWLFPVVPSRGGPARNRLPLHRALEDPRQPAPQPAAAGHAAAARARLDRAARASVGLDRRSRWRRWSFPLATGALEVLRGPRRGQCVAAVPARGASRTSQAAAARLGLQLAFMAHEASERVHAIGITLIRLVVTQRRLLEWETAAASAARGGAAGRRARSSAAWRRARRWPLLTLVADRWSVRPAALTVAAPVLAAVDRRAVDRLRAEPADRRRAGAAAGRRSRLSARRGARETWAYFDAFVDRRGPLPAARQRADASRTQVIAHRTSPTNIGLGLLATLAAHDLGFIDTAGARRAASTRRSTTGRGAASATRATCSTGTTPARWRRCCRRYVSTVDSGNLAGALIALAVGPARAGAGRWRPAPRRWSTP